VKNSSSKLADKLARIARTKKYWIKYKLGEDTLTLLEDRFSEPRTHRMRNVLIVSDTNNGKSTIAEKFLSRHRSELNITSNSAVPVLKIEATEADEERFYNKILDALPVYSKGLTARVSVKEISVLRAMRDCNVRMLMIDEIHNLLNAPPQKQRTFQRMIKSLGNELMITIVALGTYEAYNAINSDPQLGNRFQPIFLPKWQFERLADPDEPSEYRQFLAAFEKLLPFDLPSDLGNDPIADKIYSLSEGTIGEATDLLRDAATYAVRNDLPSITLDVILKCGYVAPSRRAFAPRF
jgi:hypothetical protein